MGFRSFEGAFVVPREGVFVVPHEGVFVVPRWHCLDGQAVDGGVGNDGGNSGGNGGDGNVVHATLHAR